MIMRLKKFLFYLQTICMIYTTGVKGSPSSYTHFRDYVENVKAKIWLWSIVKKIDKQSAYSC